MIYTLLSRLLWLNRVCDDFLDQRLLEHVPFCDRSVSTPLPFALYRPPTRSFAGIQVKRLPVLRGAARI